MNPVPALSWVVLPRVADAPSALVPVVMPKVSVVPPVDPLAISCCEAVPPLLPPVPGCVGV